jgi:opacity protein-like surface antigen
MGVVKTFALAISALLALSAAARAADMPEIVQQPVAAIQELGSNWYLRGDIGYRLDRVSGSDWNGLAISDPTLGNAFVLGGGFGVKLGWMRLDATADYGFPAAFQGNVPGVTTVTASIDSLVLLANAYADLGTWHGLTPYVGAGVGTAMVRNPGVGGGGGTERWNPAWALMAGVGYTVTPNVLIDVGYRYLHLGDAPIGTDQFGAAVPARGISANEVRVGVRYTID